MLLTFEELLRDRQSSPVPRFLDPTFNPVAAVTVPRLVPLLLLSLVSSSSIANAGRATPPLPQAQRAQGLAAQEFFFDYVPTSSVTSRKVQDARDCLYSFDIPRSTSAPAVALRSPRNRSLSDVSQAPSTGSSSTLSHSKPMTICPRFNATLGFITLWQPCVDKTKRSS